VLTVGADGKGSCAIYLEICNSNHDLSMMYHKRLIEQHLQTAFAAVPAVVVVGARQVGKSTLLRHLCPHASVITFDPVQDIAQARRDPDLFLANQPRPLILNEIQYAPELVPALKRAIDRDRRPGQFFITGSQQWQIMTRLAESLAGRALILILKDSLFVK
jgi:uncharacterized protein